MTQASLHYGRGRISLSIPSDNQAGFIRPYEHSETRAIDPTILYNALKDAAADDFIQTIQGRRLCILLPDATRDLPIDTCLRAVLPWCKTAHSIKFILCTGTHTAQTKDNQALCERTLSICNENHLIPVMAAIHNCTIDTFLDAGLTSRKTHIRYNAAIEEADVYLVFSDIKPHYFAGYSNPVKNFVPGICDYETARGNHSLTLDETSIYCAHPYHSNPAQQIQPLAADQVEAMEKILKGRPVYALTIISTHQAIQWAAFGPIRNVCAKAFAQADQWNLHTVKPVERLIVSPGGFPNDMDLYIAQRALELTEQAVIDGGEILFLSACQEGIGPEKSMEHFWNLLIRPFDEIYRVIEGDYKLFSHKPYRFARLIERLRKLWVYSELPPNQIEQAHMPPADNPQAIIDNWIRENPHIKILVVDGANKLALRKQL